MSKLKPAIFLACLSICFFIFSNTSNAAGPTYISYSVNTSEPWTKENSPYIVQNHTVVNVPLAIEAGTVVKFSSSLADLNIKNDFFVKGTREDPVFFTSIHDDSDGNNSDNSPKAPQMGDWSSISFNSSQDKTFEIKYAKIFYSSFGVSIYSSNNHFRNRTVKNCEIRNNGYGIRINNAEPTIENNVISNNGTGIRVDSTTRTAEASNNAIVGNNRSVWGINNINPSLTALDARFNWWGAEDGPDYQENAGQNDSGNVAVGKILYDPWLQEDPIQNPDPVIVVPGIMGSWGKDGIWQIDPIFHTFDNLCEEFLANGYEDGKNFSVFPYQWRDSNIENAKLLRDRISHIKEQTGRPKVDIVAHSMGGLLAREYIESDYYENDVDQLITVGTPHLGAPGAYIKWEAGESFWNVFDIIGKKLFQQEAKENEYDNVFSYIHGRPMLSVRELLPAYNYLFDVENEYALRESYPIDYPRNEFLENLNNDESNHLRSLDNSEFTKIIGKMNNPESTISGYSVISADMGEYWQDGYPHGFEIPIFGDQGLRLSDGDQTVPLYSAEAPNIPADRTIYLESEHNALPTDAQKDILEILTGKRPASEVNEWRIDDILIGLVFSPVDFQIMSPSGKRLGKNFETGGEFNEIEGAFYTGFNTNAEFLTIPNPENGEYKILTQGTGTGEYKIEIAKITEDDDNPQGASESAVTLEGATEIGQTEEKKIEVTENEIIYNPDTTPPIITGYATTSPNANGWYNSDVTVHFEAVDSESGIESVTPDIIISTEGKNQSATGTATDKAGNSASFTVTGVNIDKTPPKITITSPKSQTYLNNQILPIIYEITDNLSETDDIKFTTTNCSENICDENFTAPNLDLSLENIGEHTFKISAADLAGNKNQKNINFQVATNLEATKDNISRYWDSNLIKAKYEKTYLEFRLDQIKDLFKWLDQFENAILNPAMKKIITDSIKKIINSNLNQLVSHINSVSPRLIDPQAAAALVESLDFVRP